MHLLIVTTMSVALFGQANVPSGQTSVQHGWELPPRPDSRLGIDTSTSPFDVPAEPSRPLEHLVRSVVDQLPPPTEVTPLPAPSRFERLYQAENKPFTFDYVYMGKASVASPATSGVLFNTVAMDYRWTRPFFSTPAAFTFRPAAEIWFLSGPGGVDLPEQLYKFAFDFQLDIPVNERWGVSVGITPGLWSDLIVVDKHSFRLPARALLTHRFSDTLFVAAGLVYTDNIRRNLLPAGGLIWDPTDKWHLELLYPRSRIVYRYSDIWSPYFAVERGGTTWNIRLNGQDSDMEYRDIRIMLGMDIGYWTKVNLFAEVGATVYRKFRFDYIPGMNINDAFILRVGARF